MDGWWVLLSFYLKGLMIGFSIAAPVGPIGVLCIRRTLAEGRAAGLLSGLGAATADAFYGCVAGFGLTFISAFLIGQRLWIQSLGGAFLLYLGIRTFLSRPARETTTLSTVGANLIACYSSTFFLTVANPMTIHSFVAVFAGLGVLGPEGDYSLAAALVFGVFSGSALWWLILSGGIGLFRTRLNLATLQWVNRLSGSIILGFGILALLALLRIAN